MRDSSSDAREDHSAELAHHFAEAEAVLGPAKYVRYALLAGERAIANYAYEEAVAHFERALATKEGPTMDAERAELLFGLGRAQAAIMEAYQWEEAVANLGSAFDYYVGVGEAARAVAVALTPLRPEPGRSVGVTQLLIRALEMVPSDSHEAGQFLSLYGAILGLEEVDYQGAQQAFHRALEIAQREKDATLEMRTLAEAARIDYFHLNYSESLEKSLRSIPLTQHVDDPNVQVNAHIIAAQAPSRTGDLERARGTPRLRWPWHRGCATETYCPPHFGPAQFRRWRRATGPRPETSATVAWKSHPCGVPFSTTE